MRLVDLQNPIANMPLVQQIQQQQHSQAQAQSPVVQRHFQQEVNEKMTTVPETSSQDEGNRIAPDEEHESRERRHSDSGRNSSTPRERERVAKKPQPNDGIHGKHLDVQA